jgi:amino acid transporter
LQRHFGLLHATALNVSLVVGAGVFAVIPLMLVQIPGPYALLGWLGAGALIVADGLIWSELGAMMPGSGGTYLYLLEAFGRLRWGRAAAFLYIWQFLISGRLEVAVGLETIHPIAIEHLNKRLDLARFDRAADFLVSHDIDLRAFVLLGAPYVPVDESLEWTVRSVEYAAARGARRVAIIPVRGGNGEMERLQALGAFVPPTLAQLEEALEQCLPIKSTMVSADVWDIERLPACEACRPQRIARIRAMNVSPRSRLPAPTSCSACA